MAGFYPERTTLRLPAFRRALSRHREEDAASACVLNGIHSLKDRPMPLSSYKFGEFELDCARYEQRRNERVLKLERIPMELLILLAERDGNVVSRQEIIERLWGKDVFVDTEHGVNTAIRKIRLALRDNPEEPHFVQTVTGKGYRFVAERLNGNSVKIAAVEERQPPEPLKSGLGKWESLKVASSNGRRLWVVSVTTAALFLLA